MSRLDTLLSLAQEQRRVRQALEIRVLKAQALAACRRGHEARQELQLVLAQCCGEGFMRLFLDEGPSLAALLRSLLPSLHGAALRSYARSILRAFGTVPEATTAPDTLPIEPLSAQEERVLRLLAAGRSNPEIAGELFVSVNTVKGHVKSLYGKLNVRNRLEAADAARRLAPR
jgi:LuxR family maltose regulon positive regulatory protein